MTLSLHHSLQQLVYDGFFIEQIKKTLHQHDVTVAQHDYDDLQLRLVRVVSSQRLRIHEKTTEIIKELEDFTSAVRYIVYVTRDGDSLRN